MKSASTYGDAKAVAQALGQRLQGLELACDASKAERAATIQSEKDAWTHETDAYSLDAIEEARDEKSFSGGQWLHPRQVLRELETPCRRTSW